MTLLLMPGGDATATPGGQRHAVAPLTGAGTSETRNGGVTPSLTQILPDQARAFYVDRGFSGAATEASATPCVLINVLRNDTAYGVLHYAPANWQVRAAEQDRPPLSAAHGRERLRSHAPGQAALIAFRWAQFPPEQAYQPGGDWNQGMLTITLAPGSRFDRVARWDISGKPYEEVMNDVVCPD